jgi:type II secretory pathway pseudopilin PulG
MHYQRPKITGAVGLLELMLTLMIIGVILALGTAYYYNAQTSNAVNLAMQNAQGLYGAFTKCIADNGSTNANTTCSISQMVSQNYLPSMYQPSSADCTANDETCTSSANPWGGSMLVALIPSPSKLCSTDTSPYVQVTITAIPQKACMQLVGRLTQSFTTGQCISDPSCADENSNTVEINY